MAFSAARTQAPVIATKDDLEKNRRLDPRIPEELDMLVELAEEFHPGMRVKAVHFEDYEGVVRFIGNTVLGEGPWIGIELDEPVGRTNGSVSGVFYFDCPDSHGAFVPPDCVEPLERVDAVEPIHTWDLGDHHFSALKRKHDRQATMAPSALTAYQQQRLDAGDDGARDFAYFKSLPPQIRGRSGASGKRRGASESLSVDSSFDAHRSTGGPASGPVTAGARGHASRGGGVGGGVGGVGGVGGATISPRRAPRRVVPYYEAFAPVHKRPEVNQRVRVNGQLGIVRFVGPTLFEFGEWVGVELDKPLGRNNGTVNGTLYFKTRNPRAHHGIFVRQERVEWIPWEFAPLQAKTRARRPDDTRFAALTRQGEDEPQTAAEVVEVSSDDEAAGAGDAAGTSNTTRGSIGAAAGAAGDDPSHIWSGGDDGNLSRGTTAGGAGAAGAGSAYLVENGVFVSRVPDDASSANIAQLDDATDDGMEARPVSFVYGASNMTFYHLDAKLEGLLQGALVGSAIGLLTDALTPELIAAQYPLGLLGYAAVARDAHRSKWYFESEPGGVWGVSGDQVLVTLQALLARGGQVSDVAFAAELARWAKDGFAAQLGQTEGLGMSETMSAIVSAEEFVGHPALVAKNKHLQTGKSFASNEALPRAVMLGLSFFWDLDTVAANAEALCATTHSDPRSIASCVAVAVVIACLLQKRSRSYQRTNLLWALKTALKYAKRAGVPDEAALEAAILTADIDTLRLSDLKTAKHTYKCLGAAFWALRTGTDFTTTIEAIARRGGDSEANCSLAGALLGVKLGMWTVPLDWPPKSLPLDARTWPPVKDQFFDGVDPCNIPEDWLALRDSCKDFAGETYRTYLDLLKLTIDTYSTKREF